MNYEDGAEDEFTDYYDYSMSLSTGEEDWEDVDDNEDINEEELSVASTTFRRSDIMPTRFVCVLF